MTFWQKVKIVCSSIWEFVEPFVKIFLTKAGPLLAAAATQAVTSAALQLTDAEGSNKKEYAFALIVEDLKRQGIVLGAEVSTSMVNAAIEAAVAKLKAEGV